MRPAWTAAKKTLSSSKRSPLLPPLKLYREILRAHRKLPKAQKGLGDEYVRAEFRAHKNIDNPLQIVGFLSSWQNYLVVVKKNTHDDWKKYRIPEKLLEKMSDDQIIQFYELMKETRNIYSDKHVEEETHVEKRTE
ncbi:hypothetical protein HII12_003434 [Brettanomyces bruxellensis]|uniref:Succinate dehydrogenase assembly factor 3 n=1 Tax=Dekkera bruxellensis TaxID=5007 RepID=A0A7D9H105_DEKBR|nr:hypothetical protein HII12_003434 [Brettanomyces bruxellensis]VUG17647.1 SDH7 [Brettanomyces bruxellensis]